VYCRDLFHVLRFYNVVEVSVLLQIGVPIEKVWNIISKVDNDPNYWKCISRIRNMSRDRNIITRKIYMSNGSKCQQKITLFPKEGIHVQWMRGPIIGTKDIMLVDNGGTTIIRVQINYKLGEVTRARSANILDELQSEAEHALQLIKKQVE
jgi:uncharacterized membrane protein